MFPFERVARMQGGAAVVWGLVLVIWPQALYLLLGASSDEAGHLMGRFAGGMMFALGVSILAVRSSQDIQIRRTVALANAATDLVMAAVLLLAAVAGTTSGVVAWMVVFFFLLNTVSWLGTTRDLPAG